MPPRLIAQYSHYRYKFPAEQHEPHRSFATERAYLDELFGDGKAATLGAGPKSAPAEPDEPCWHIYWAGLDTERNADAVRRLAGSSSLSPMLSVALAGGPAGASDEPGYRTPQNDDYRAAEGVSRVFEVAMEGLSSAFTRHFFYEDSKPPEPEAVGVASGIWRLLPGVSIDAWCFEPCGYSLNGHRECYYYTMHITPEAHMSFASFETNDPSFATANSMEAILAIMEPDLATYTVAERGPAPGGDSMPYKFFRASGYEARGESVAHRDGESVFSGVLKRRT